MLHRALENAADDVLGDGGTDADEAKSLEQKLKPVLRNVHTGHVDAQGTFENGHERQQLRM